MATNAPLSRLLKRRDITPLLTTITQAMPETRLALLEANGNLFVEVGTWDSAELAMVQLTAPPPPHLRIYPLIVEQTPLGLLVTDVAAHTATISCLQQSLILLLNQAIEKRAITQEALERYREINLLYQVGERISSVLDPTRIAELTLSEAARVIQSDVGAVLLPTSPVSNRLTVKASFGYTNTELELFGNATRYIVEHVHESSQPSIFTALSLASSPVDGVLCAPLRVRGQAIGVILLGRAHRVPIFTASDEKLLLAIASQAAIAMQTAWLHQQEVERQQIEKELALGQQIQHSLLPQALPTIDGWDFAAIYKSARQVGGDFYDIFCLTPDSPRLGMLIADATGKGVPAALFMAFSHSIIRTTARSGQSPATVLQQANQLIMADNQAGIFLTAFYAILDTDTGTLCYANGGHHWPLYLPVDTNECHDLDPAGFLLGALPEITLEEEESQLQAGDVILFFTDGVPEAMNPAGEMFGEDRLRAVALQHVAQSASDILDAIVSAVHEFTGDIPQSDDFTLFIVKRSRSDSE